MSICPVYAYDLSGKFEFEAPSIREMARILNTRLSNISKVLCNDIPGEDNGRYTAANHYIKRYKKEQLTDEDMMIESRKQIMELTKTKRSKPRGPYRKHTM